MIARFSSGIYDIPALTIIFTYTSIIYDCEKNRVHNANNIYLLAVLSKYPSNFLL